MADYWIIGDLQTSAPVGADGSTDWFWCPHVDSPSVVGALSPPAVDKMPLDPAVRM